MGFRVFAEHLVRTADVLVTGRKTLRSGVHMLPWVQVKGFRVWGLGLVSGFRAWCLGVWG